MRRIKADYEQLGNFMDVLGRQAGLLARDLEARSYPESAGKIKLVARRLENINGFCANLGNTTPGLDASNLKKIEAEWKVCHRLAKNTTGLGPFGSRFQALLEAMVQADVFLKGLLAGAR